MEPDPEDFLWLGADDSPLRNFGCVTIAEYATEEAYLALGIDADRRIPGRIGSDVESNTAVVGGSRPPSDGPLIVFEPNGQQAIRDGVLARVSSRGRAASACWDPDDSATVVLAQNGEIVASYDLLDPAPDGSMDSLAPYLALAAADDVDLRAVAAAMIVSYVGISFTSTDLREGVRFELVPTLVDLPSETVEHSPLRDLAPDLAAAIGRCGGEVQRRIAETAARLALENAGVFTGRDLLSAEIDRAVAVPGAVSAAVAKRIAEIYRSASDAEDAWMYASDGAPPDAETRHLMQLRWMARAVEYVGHPDPATAALCGAYAATLSLRNADQTGRAGLVEELHTAVHTLVELGGSA
jgi:hypothetical protein